MVNRKTTLLLMTVIILWGIFNCDRKEYYQEKYKTNVAALLDSIIYFQNKLNSQTASSKVLILEKKELLSAILQKDRQVEKLSREFSKLKSIIKYDSHLKLDTIRFKFSDPLTKDNDNLIRVERTGTINTRWYSLGYKINNDSLMIAPLEISNSATLITGLKRNWFLGKETLMTDITHSNPYLVTTDIRSADILLKVPWYKKWYFWLIAGAAGGLILR